MPHLIGRLFAALLLAASSLFGQEATLLGLGNGAATTLGAEIFEVSRGCRRLNACGLPAGTFARTISAPLGGVAYDASRGVLWATDGTQLAVLSERCGVIRSCAIPPAANPPWTGLSIDPTGQRLFFTAAGSLGIYSVAASCPPGVARLECSVPSTSSNGPLTGLDVDPWDGSLWVSDAAGTVLHIDRSVPGACRVVGSFRISCPNSPPSRPIHGIAIDRCENALFLADDRGGLVKRSMNPAAFECCVEGPLPSGFHLVGLARRPARAVRSGHGCAQGACPPCVPRIEVPRPAVMPNPAFAVGLSGASPGTTAFLLMSPLGGPTFLPSLCAPLQVAASPAPLLLGPLPVVAGAGTTPCDGGTMLPLPLAVDSALCGGVIFAQWMTFCIGPGNALGLMLSDGLAITIS